MTMVPTFHSSIGHDNSCSFAAWHLDSVAINVPSLFTKWSFHVDKWLDDGNEHGVVVEVTPHEVEVTSTEEIIGGEKIFSSCEINSSRVQYRSRVISRVKY